VLNPGRAISGRPSISPGLTNDVLGAVPTLAEIEPDLAKRISGRYLLGYNIGVDWRLLHWRCPDITLRLARHLNAAPNNGLVALQWGANPTARCGTPSPHRSSCQPS